jgi:tyrosine-protein phosphatase YwqE
MAVELVERGFAAAVATDAHSCRVRTPWMRDIREVLTREVSALCAGTLLLENPGRILKNEELVTLEPEWF